MTAAYVIQRTDGAYVQDMRVSTDGHSYTRMLQNAQRYRTREAAQNDLCVENERIMPVDNAFRGRP